MTARIKKCKVCGKPRNFLAMVDFNITSSGTRAKTNWMCLPCILIGFKEPVAAIALTDSKRNEVPST